MRYIVTCSSRFTFSLCRKIHIHGREVSHDICLPPYVVNKFLDIPSKIPIKSDTEINDCRYASSIVRNIFDRLSKFIKPGISTQLIDDFVFEKCVSNLAYPSPLGYCGFPKSVCTSLNEVACHGIPSPFQVLTHGDLISVDISVFTGRAHGDACRSYVVIDDQKNGDDTEQVQKPAFLCNVARKSCMAGVQICGPGVFYTEIAKAISEQAVQHGCTVIPGICGHGIGWYFHGPPTILHSVEEQPTDEVLTMKPGHLFTIEPCVAYRNEKWTKVNNNLAILDDGWSVVTKNYCLIAQHEEMVLVTQDGYEVLT